MKVVTIGDWQKAKEILEAAPDLLEKACDAAVVQEATWIVAEMKKKFRALAPPNSAFTAIMKRSSKPGINKGDLRNAIGVVRTGKMSAFVGVPATPRMVSGGPGRGAGGKFTKGTVSQAKVGSNARLADIIENGRTIVMRMTDKQRKFLHASLGKKVSKVGGSNNGVLVIHIPPRPFIKPTFEMAMHGAHDRLLGRVLDNLKRLKP